MKETPNNIKLFHVTTVPQSLYYFLDGQVRFMAEHGFEVHGVSSPGKLLGLFAERENADVHAIEMPRAISPLQDLVALLKLYRLFRRHQPDIVHAHTPKGGLLGMMAAFLGRVPIRIYTVHGLPHVTATGLKRKLLRFTEKISCSLAHRVFTVSSSLVDQVGCEGFCLERKISVIKSGSINGVNSLGHFNPKNYRKNDTKSSLGIPQDALVIGFVGRLVRDKGILELIDAWRVLRETFTNLHLLLVGPYEEKNDIPEPVKIELSSDTRVHLTGHVLDTAPYYSAMDVLAFPTHREGFGLVAIEAAAMQTPVVSTRIPGCIDSIADGETGTLVSSGNSEALTAALASYLGNSSLRRKHGEAGRRRVLSIFNPEDIWQELFKQYVELTATIKCST